MFVVRQYRRNAIVKKILRHAKSTDDCAANDDDEDPAIAVEVRATPEAAEAKVSSPRTRALAQMLVKRLSECDLKALLRALDTGGAADTQCAVAAARPTSSSSRSHPVVLSCSVFRWHDVRHVSDLRRLDFCLHDNCVNPFHWSRMYHPGRALNVIVKSLPLKQ
jgi:hypothetical protein